MLHEFEASGFQASRGLKSYAGAVLSEVASEAPASVHKVVAKLSRRANSYMCRIEADSAFRVTIATEVVARSPKGALQEAAAAMKNKFLTWRSLTPIFQRKDLFRVLPELPS